MVLDLLRSWWLWRKLSWCCKMHEVQCWSWFILVKQRQSFLQLPLCGAGAVCAAVICYLHVLFSSTIELVVLVKLTRLSQICQSSTFFLLTRRRKFYSNILNIISSTILKLWINAVYLWLEEMQPQSGSQVVLYCGRFPVHPVLPCLVSGIPAAASGCWRV